MNLVFSVIGAEVVGIWPRKSDKGDVNTACVTGNANALATGDDFGFVKLFPFPCTEKYVSIIDLMFHICSLTKLNIEPY